MSTPLYSAVIGELYPRAAIFVLHPMASDPASEHLAMPDIGLQLILEGLHRNDQFPTSGPGAAELTELKQLWLEHTDTAYKAFYAVARHLIYDVESVVELGVVPPHSDEMDGGAWGNSATVTVLGRFPWLFCSLRKHSFWESYIFSYHNLAWS